MAEARTYKWKTTYRPALRGPAGCCLIVLVALLAPPALRAADTNHATAKPSIVIPVEPLGYGPPGELYLMMRYSQVSLDFLDSGHLLFTFQKKVLLRHSADETQDDDDQLIHAVVLDLPDGKVSASSDWRMHDRQRYLWPLGPGVFLVRQRGSLFLTDSSLELRPYGQFPGLVGVQVSPGGELMVAQTDETEEQEESPDKQSGSTQNPVASQFRPANAKPILLQVFRVKDRALVARSRVRRPTSLSINGSGFVESLEGKPNQWMLSFTPLTEGSAGATPVPFAQLTSDCQPMLTFVSRDTMLAIRCTPSYDHLATVLTLDGKILWERKWQSKRVWPTMAYSQDGSRFAEGMLIGPGGFAVTRPLGSDDISGQQVDVFDTVSGKPLLSAPASPVYDAGQNFALSADGRRFAILHRGAIEIYDLPAEAR